jgi:hypothetical protein
MAIADATRTKYTKRQELHPTTPTSEKGLLADFEKLLFALTTFFAKENSDRYLTAPESIFAL